MTTVAETETQHATTVKAIIRERYGPPEALRLVDVEKPEPADDEVVVRVRATSVNRADWYTMTGTPYVARPMTGLLKPKSPRLGGDFAGTVEAVGKDVTDLQAGDDVFGVGGGAFAEYVSAGAGIASKPRSVTFEEAAAVPIAGLTALQGLRDHGQVRPGQHVLINGASGGVGTFAVQIAKALGAEVTAVCSTRNVDVARSLGADHAVDYTREDFTRGGRRYDLMLDIAGSKSWSQCGRVLQPHAALVLIGAPKGGPFMGPLSHIARVRLASVRGRQKFAFFVAKPNRLDLQALGELLETGKVRPVLERRYELGDIADALRYMGEGHVQGKLVVTI